MISKFIFLFLLSSLVLFAKRLTMLKVMMAIELFLLSINLLFTSMSQYAGDGIGMLFVLIVFAVAAAETAIGLALFTIYYRRYGHLSINQLNKIGENEWFRGY